MATEPKPLDTVYDKDGRRVPFLYPRGLRYMSGRWLRRDGDTYGTVAPQPQTPLPRPEPAVHADNPTGHLRPSEVSGD